MDISERRSAPRFIVSLPGSVLTSSEFRSEIEVTNISSSGLQFGIGQFAMPQLVPNQSENNQLEPVHVKLSIFLADINQLLEIECGIVYVKRKSIDECSVGCRFERFIENSDRHLENYLTKLSANPTVLIENEGSQ